MSNFSDFFPVAGGGGLTPKFEEFNSSGTFTPSQALIDAGGYIELFLVGGGGKGIDGPYGGSGGETILKKMYLTSTTDCNVTIGSGATSAGGGGGTTSFAGSSAGGSDVSAFGGTGNYQNSYKISNRQSSGYGMYAYSQAFGAAGTGFMGWGAGGTSSDYNSGGIQAGKANSGQGSPHNQNAGSGYCLIKYYE